MAKIDDIHCGFYDLRIPHLAAVIVQVRPTLSEGALIFELQDRTGEISGYVSKDELQRLEQIYPDFNSNSLIRSFRHAHKIRTINRKEVNALYLKDVSSCI